MTPVTDDVFGRLTVRVCFKDGKHWKAACRCKCGNISVVRVGRLLYGDTRSCGCLRGEIASKVHLRHGGTRGEKSTEYKVWRGMKA